jgi:hypothetical protein
MPKTSIWTPPDAAPRGQHHVLQKSSETALFRRKDLSLKGLSVPIALGLVRVAQLSPDVFREIAYKRPLEPYCCDVRLTAVKPRAPIKRQLLLAFVEERTAPASS